jgi:hypothetical protein
VRKVAIVGKAGTSGFAPWRDETWEIWGMPWISCPRVTRLFDIHSQARWDEPSMLKDEDWIGMYRETYPDVPVYCDPSRMGVFLNPVAFPLEEVCASLPIQYLENTIAYELALAIHEGVDEIGLWGIHMMGSGEYAAERPSVAYLVGLAQGRGIKVTIPPGSPLFMSCHIAGRYGLAGGKRF